MILYGPGHVDVVEVDDECLFFVIVQRQLGDLCQQFGRKVQEVAGCALTL